MGLFTFQYFSFTCVKDILVATAVICPGTEAIYIMRSFTEPPEATEELFVEEVEAFEVGPPSTVDDDDDGGGCFLLASKSNAILMAKYLQRCSTSALEVVLIYRVALSFMASMTSFCSRSANMSGCNLKTISIS